jgi:hypothetical protein
MPTGTRRRARNYFIAIPDCERPFRLDTANGALLNPFGRDDPATVGSTGICRDLIRHWAEV